MVIGLPEAQKSPESKLINIPLKVRIGALPSGHFEGVGEGEWEAGRPGLFSFIKYIHGVVQP